MQPRCGVGTEGLPRRRSNIATIHGLDQSDGVKFLVMALADGDTLAQRLKHGPSTSALSHSCPRWD